MRIMAIDYGDARTGYAISDASGLLAGETGVLPSRNEDKLLEDLCRIYGEKEVGRIALGLPRNMDGSEGPRAEKSRALKEKLEERGCQVALVDERRTTVEAHAILTETGRRGKQRKKRVDAVAASLILETYLNAHREEA
ncbi:MAG: Holliday junction resolvase RuvX [Oscillospiraceae bacterium]|nr:Holliday junction resolvase RuvX [Oscillospiraceae bacterium]